MIWDNPCKECLIRAVCINPCKEIEKYGSYFYYFIQSSLILFMILISLLPIFIIKHYLVAITEGLIYLCCYYFVKKELKKREACNKTEKVLITLFGPFLLITVRILENEYYEDKVYNFIFKFNEKVKDKFQ